MPWSRVLRRSVHVLFPSEPSSAVLRLPAHCPRSEDRVRTVRNREGCVPLRARDSRAFVTRREQMIRPTYGDASSDGGGTVRRGTDGEVAHARGELTAGDVERLLDAPAEPPRVVGPAVLVEVATSHVEELGAT